MAYFTYHEIFVNEHTHVTFIQKDKYSSLMYILVNSVEQNYCTHHESVRIFQYLQINTKLYLPNLFQRQSEDRIFLISTELS